MVTLSPGDSTVQVRDLRDMRCETGQGPISVVIQDGNVEFEGRNRIGHEATGQGDLRMELSSSR